MADQPQTHETHTVETRSVRQTTSKPRTGMVIAIAILILLLVGVGIFFAWKKKKSPTAPEQSAGDIRNIFTPPTTTSPSFVPPPPSYYYTNTNTGTPSSTPNAQGGQPGGTGYPTPPKQNRQPPAVAGVTTYQNSGLGFQVVIPTTWVASQSGSTIFFYDRTTGQPQASVEVYNSDGATLGDLGKILSGSPSVSNVSQTSVDGQPALRYVAATPASSGITYIANGKIYYLHGAFLDPKIASNFHSTASGTGYIPPTQNNTPYQNPGPTYYPTY